MKPFFPFALSAAALTLISCGPVEPEVNDSGALYSQASVGQWEPDLHDSRQVLDRLTLQKLNEEIAAGSGVTAATTFGSEPATETYTYLNPVRGFSVDLPYSTNWGSSTYVVPPYYLYEEVSELRFGPLQTGEGGGYGRTHTLAFRPAKNAEAVVKEAEAEQGALMQNGMPDSYKPRIMQGSGVTLVQWVSAGLCMMPHVEVIGERFNYRFTTCSFDPEIEAHMQELTDIARSVRILP